MSKFEITAESTPVYDTWGWDRGGYWGCFEWEKWFYALKDKLGREQATNVWVQAWNKQTLGASPLDCRTFNRSFKDFILKEKLDKYIQNFISKILGAGVDIVDSASNVASQTASGVSNASKTLKYVIPVALFLAVIGVSAYAYRTFVK